MIKFMVTLLILFVLAVGIGIYDEVSSKWACSSLKPRYFQLLTATSGPFLNVEMAAVDFQDKTIGLIPNYQVGYKINKIYYIKCKDLRSLE